MAAKDFKQRLEAYIRHKSLTIHALEHTMGFSKGSLAKALKKGNSMTTDRLGIILDYFPQLSPNWLYKGIEPMELPLALTQEHVPNEVQIRKQLKTLRLTLKDLSEQNPAHSVLNELEDTIDNILIEQAKLNSQYIALLEKKYKQLSDPDS